LSDYGQALPDKLIGVSCGGVDYITRLRSWVVLESKGADFKTASVDSGKAEQARIAPCSSFNNCTLKNSINEVIKKDDANRKDKRSIDYIKINWFFGKSGTSGSSSKFGGTAYRVT